MRSFKIPRLNFHLLTAFVLCSSFAPKLMAQTEAFEEQHRVYPIDLGHLPKDQQVLVLKKFPKAEKGLSKEQIDQLIRMLQSEPNIDLVQVYEKDEHLEIKIVRTQRIRSIKFIGLRQFSESEVKSILNINPQDPFDQQNLIESGERLRQTYKDSGFLNTIIDVEMPSVAEGQMDLVFKIQENRPTQISNVSIQSKNEDLNQDLTKLIRYLRNKTFTENNLAEAIRDLKEFLGRNRYFRAEIVGPLIQFNSDETQAQVLYRIERPDRFQVSYEYNKYLNKREIDSILDLDHFTSSNPNIGLELSTKLRQAYLSLGFARVEIQADESPGRESNTRLIHLNIDEGPRIKIEKIQMQGRYRYPNEYYSEFLLNNSPGVISKSYYSKDDIESGVKLLVTHLQNEGFLLAHVISTRAQYNAQKDKVTLMVNLDEGPLTEIDGVNFEGNYFTDRSTLLRVAGLADSGPLRLNAIEKAIGNLKNFYTENGFIEMQILNEKDDLVNYHDENTKANLIFKIQEGPKVKVGSIIIEGNSFTKDKVILTELDFEPGDILTPNKIEESISRLQKTGYFGNVEIRTLEERTSVSNRTVIVRITERDPGIFSAGLGATNERDLTLRGYLGVAYRNIGGTGRAISSRLEGNYNVATIRYLESKITLGYLEPYIFGTRNRGRINISRAKSVTDYEARQASEVNQSAFTVERDFTSHILGIFQLWGMATVRDYSISNENPFPETLVDIATVGPSVDFDYRDNPFNPTSGSFAHLAYEYSSPELGSSSTINYYKFSSSYTHYLKLNESPLIWANQFRFGYLQNLSTLSNGGVPWDKVGFTLGGRSTVRGFEAGTSEVFPNKDDLGSSKYYLKTQSRMYLFKSEIRFPIYGNFAGALFYDGGSVEIDGLSLTDPYRDAAGVGLRYITPFGPLNIEIGYKLDRKEGEEAWRYHLSIGTF